jgi:rRNA maturation endonuclease Nob1
VLAVTAAALLLYLRVVIHDALLVEGAEHEIGADSLCPECHRMVPTMQFCPSCGAARAAAPKQTRVRVAGGV